jgi:hypothetical protein
MPCGNREHHLGSGAQDLIHRTRIRTAIAPGHPLSRHSRSCHIPHQRVPGPASAEPIPYDGQQATRNPSR